MSRFGEPALGSGDVYLARISVALGEVSRSVDAAAAAGVTLSSAAQLRHAGFEMHRVCQDETTTYDLARRAVLGTGLDASAVGVVLWASCLPGNATMDDHGDFARTRDVKHLMRYPASRLQSELGFSHADVIGLTQQGCTGLLGAVRLARALLLTEPDLDPILCLTADRFPAGAVYEQAYNLVSDGAVAFSVSRRVGPYRVLGVQQLTNGGLYEADDDETVGTHFTYSCAVIEKTCERLGITSGQLDWVVAQNTNVRVAPILAHLLGLPEDRVHAPTVGEVGHLIAGDAFLNLEDLRHSGRARSGELVAVPIAGYGMNWQCAVLQLV